MFHIQYFLYILVIPILVIFFFFSSRRRHTMFSRDWSSDVCSSDLLERPAVRHRDRVELLARLGEADVQRALAVRDSGEQELERERRLPRARVPLDEVHPAVREPSVEHGVEPCDAGRQMLQSRWLGYDHRTLRACESTTAMDASLRIGVPDGQPRRVCPCVTPAAARRPAASGT